MKRIKRIKNEAKHNQFLKILEAVRKNYELLRSDKVATAMSGIINIMTATGEFSIEQLKQGIEFNDTELGHLVACLFEYLNEHPALLEVDGFLESAEQIANNDGEDNEGSSDDDGEWECDDEEEPEEN